MKTLKLLIATICLSIFCLPIANASTKNDEKKLTGSKWITTDETGEKTKNIIVEFIADTICVFIVEEKLASGSLYTQPSPRCKYKFNYPEVTFTEGKFFDYNMNFYKPLNGIIKENDLEITLDNNTTHIFIPYNQ